MLHRGNETILVVLQRRTDSVRATGLFGLVYGRLDFFGLVAGNDVLDEDGTF